MSGVLYKTFDGCKVSRQWHWLLTDARNAGVSFHVNSGHRTLAEQTRLHRQNMVFSGGRFVQRRNADGTLRPLTAFPSPTAPHIRVGRADHAVDVNDENLFAPGGGFERLQDWARKHGVTIARTVASEAWHGEANRSQLRAYARRARRRHREAEKRRKLLHGRVPAKQRKLSRRGLDLIARFEGFVPYAYNDPVGFATVAYGHLLGRRPVNDTDRARYGTKEHPKVTKAEGLDLLREDAGFREDVIRTLVKVPLRQGEYDALVSLTFNIGAAGFANSTLLRHLNQEHRLRAANEFLRWNKAGGRTLLGLSRRRRAERKLFRSK